MASAAAPVGGRAQQKVNHVAFQRALLNLSPQHPARTTYAELQATGKKSLASKFIAAWLAGRDWNFVASFRTETMQEVRTQEKGYAWVTEEQMRQKYGASAEAVMEKKRAAGPSQYVIDSDDEQPRFRTRDVSAREVTSHTRATGVELRRDAPPALPSSSTDPAPRQAEPLALKDEEEPTPKKTKERNVTVATALADLPKPVRKRLCARMPQDAVQLLSNVPLSELQAFVAALTPEK